MGASKTHHFVPRGILKNFASSKPDHVWVFNKSEAKTFPQNIGRAGAENHLNTYKTNDGAKRCYEGCFQKIDDKLASIGRKLVEKGTLCCLSQEEVGHLSTLIAVQLIRTPMFRSTSKDTMAEIGKLYSKLGFDKEAKGIVPDENALKQSTLYHLQQIGKHSWYLSQKVLELVVNETETGFITSDSPVVIWNVMPHGDAGLGAIGSCIFYAISPHIALLYRCQSTVDSNVRNKIQSLNSQQPKQDNLQEMVVGGGYNRCPQKVDSQFVETMNELQIARARRFLYSREELSEVVQGFIQKHPRARDTGSHISNVFENPNDRIPMGTWVCIQKSYDYCMIEIHEQELRGLTREFLISKEDYEKHRTILETTGLDIVAFYRDQKESGGMRQVDLVCKTENDQVRIIASNSIRM